MHSGGDLILQNNPLSFSGGRSLAAGGVILASCGAIFAPKPWNTPWVSAAGDAAHAMVVDAVVAWLFFPACLISVAIFLALGISAKEPPATITTSASQKVPNWWAVSCLFIVLAGLAARWPGLSHSLWWDEVWTLTRVVGLITANAETTANDPVFATVRWRDTLFYYPAPTNHILYSALARIVQIAFGWLAPAGTMFNEAALRLPAIVAGIAAIPLLARLGRIWGLTGAGLLAGLLLALHPWAIRYSTDARAYALITAAVPIVMLAMTALARNPHDRRAQFTYYAAQFCLIWAFPYGVLFAGWCGLFLLWQYLHAHATVPRQAIWLRLRPWLRGHIYLATFLLPLLLPLLAQSIHWDAIASNAGRLAPVWFFSEVWSLFTLGISFSPDPHLPSAWYPSSGRTYFTLADAGAWHWFALLFVTGILPVVACMGFLRVWHIHPAARTSLLAVLSFPLAMVLVALGLGQFLYPRFLIFSFPPVLLLLAAGILGPGKWQRGPRVALASVTVAILILAQQPERRALWTMPVAPLRETAAMVAQLKAQNPGSLAASVGLGADRIQIYLPGMMIWREPAMLKRFLREEAHQGTLYLVIGHAPFNHAYFPELMQWLNDNPLVELVAELSAYDLHSAQQIYRIRTGKSD